MSQQAPLSIPLEDVEDALKHARLSFESTKVDYNPYWKADIAGKSQYVIQIRSRRLDDRGDLITSGNYHLYYCASEEPTLASYLRWFGSQYAHLRSYDRDPDAWAKDLGFDMNTSNGAWAANWHASVIRRWAQTLRRLLDDRFDTILRSSTVWQPAKPAPAPVIPPEPKPQPEVVDLF